ncbi:MAG: uracil-DNA glycosylase [Candidatus Moranbacteria bacterium]|nr:uracil-DNA glycosylase [Candidatus Moranbacteria bacterium]
MEKEKALVKIHSKHEQKCTCALRATATRAVWGCGNADADIVFIGEAPGKKEDQQGVPFVGSAGKFLGEMLASIGLARADIYITNIVKYRPPDNRDPLPEEKAACQDWLTDEIRLIDPRLIIPLGRHALTYFLPDARISEVHGQLFTQAFPKLGTRSVVSLYHPAAALYNGGLRMTLKEDFLKIPSILKTLNKRVVPEKY